MKNIRKTFHHFQGPKKPQRLEDDPEEGFRPRDRGVRREKWAPYNRFLIYLN